jgi:CrcB protein
MNFVYVAIGGALGAMLRYSLNYLPVSTAFPFKTLIANIFGSFIIGMIAGVADIKGVDEKLSLLLKVGFCGGFTTFSTFSLETMTLIEKGDWGVAAIYAATSVIVCVLFCVAGIALAKYIV